MFYFIKLFKINFVIVFNILIILNGTCDNAMALICNP